MEESWRNQSFDEILREIGPDATAMFDNSLSNPTEHASSEATNAATAINGRDAELEEEDDDAAHWRRTMSWMRRRMSRTRLGFRDSAENGVAEGRRLSCPAASKSSMRKMQIRRGVASGAGAIGAVALGATAVGALAVGAAAIGALAIGALSIRRLRLQEGRIEELHIQRLTVGELDIQSRRTSEEAVVTWLRSSRYLAAQRVRVTKFLFRPRANRFP